MKAETSYTKMAKEMALAKRLLDDYKAGKTNPAGVVFGFKKETGLLRTFGEIEKIAEGRK